MISNRTAYVVLGLIVAGYLAIGTLYAIKTPEWQAPDEPAHYNYVVQVAKAGCCPVIASGDWDSDALEKLKAEGFPPDADISRIQYEDHQPPAYYLIGALIFLATSDSLIALRLLSLAFGAGVILAAYVGLRRLFPRQPALALTGAAFVAFLSQFIAIAASVNNDSFAVLIVSILAVVGLTYLGNPITPDHDGRLQPYDVARRPHAAALGGLMGVAFVTKLTIYFPAAVIVGLAILLRWQLEKHLLRWLIEQIAWVVGMSLAFALAWWIRDITIYGWPDVAGLLRHDAVVVGQPLTADLINRVGMGEYIRQYASTVYHSFFGQFGWMGVPMPPRFYLGIGLFLIFTLIGLTLFVMRYRKTLSLEPAQKAALWMLGGLMLATIAGLIVYNFRFVQFQGRYLYPMLLPLAGLVALGLRGWVLVASHWLKGQVWEIRLAWMSLILLAWMPVLCLWALFKFIVPNLQ